MRVFVTGANGWIGSVVVKDLIGAGHQVLGLVRSDAAAQTVVAAGAEAHRGDLEDLESLRAGAAASDGVIHTAFNHDFSKYAANCEADRQAIEAMGGAMAGSGRALVVASGTAIISPGRLATEDTPITFTSAQVPRAASEEAADALVSKGVRASSVRLPPSVHGAGDKGFVPQIIAMARAKGVSAYVGDGRNRWPAVHRLDAARLFRLALEKGVAGGKYHAIGDEGVAVGDIAAVIARRLNLPLVSKTPEEAGEHFGFLGMFLGLDCPASAAKTMARLGWSPTQLGIVSDLDQPHYFEL
jgi:nucleoside-diphosphate-sugar epimerase